MTLTDVAGRITRCLGLSIALALLAPGVSAEAAAQTVFASRANASKCMDVYRGSLDEGNYLQLYACHGEGSQQFILQADGHLVVMNGQRDHRGYQMCVDYYPSSGRDGDPVTIWPCHPISSTTDSQLWTRTASGQLRGASGRCIDVQGGNGAAQGGGTPRLVMWTCDQYASKSWDARGGSGAAAEQRAAEERRRQEEARRAAEQQRAQEEARLTAERLRVQEEARRAEAARQAERAAATRYASKEEYCFGAVGSMCDGAPKAGVTKNADGTVTLKASVGSILHDNCCLANPGGKFCGGAGTDGQPAKEFNHNGTCVAEWDKAFWNTLSDDRQWDVTMDPRARSDLTLVSNPRTARFQNGTTSSGFETVATRRLAAPAGTALDVGDQAFCESGNAGKHSFLGKEWIVCAPRAVRLPRR